MSLRSPTGNENTITLDAHTVMPSASEASAFRMGKTDSSASPQNDIRLPSRAAIFEG
jgi:hypothetical protein